MLTTLRTETCRTLDHSHRNMRRTGCTGQGRVDASVEEHWELLLRRAARCSPARPVALTGPTSHLLGIMVAVGDGAGPGAAPTDDCEEKRRQMREVSRCRTSAAVRDCSPCNGVHGFCRCTTSSLLLPVKVQHTYNINIYKFSSKFLSIALSLHVRVSLHFIEHKSPREFY